MKEIRDVVSDVTVSVPARHLMSQRFHDLLREIGDLHDRKQSDYGRVNDPFANVTGSSEWGIRPWVGAMLRANDKLKRLQKYAQDGTLANEGARDSFLDLAVYALIGAVLWQKEQGEKLAEVESGIPTLAEPKTMPTCGVPTCTSAEHGLGCSGPVGDGTTMKDVKAWRQSRLGKIADMGTHYARGERDT